MSVKILRLNQLMSRSPFPVLLLDRFTQFYTIICSQSPSGKSLVDITNIQASTWNSVYNRKHYGMSYCFFYINLWKLMFNENWPITVLESFNTYHFGISLTFMPLMILTYLICIMHTEQNYVMFSIFIIFLNLSKTWLSLSNVCCFMEGGNKSIEYAKIIL